VTHHREFGMGGTSTNSGAEMAYPSRAPSFNVVHDTSHKTIYSRDSAEIVITCSI